MTNEELDAIEQDLRFGRRKLTLKLMYEVLDAFRAAQQREEVRTVEFVDERTEICPDVLMEHRRYHHEIATQDSRTERGVLVVEDPRDKRRAQQLINDVHAVIVADSPSSIGKHRAQAILQILAAAGIPTDVGPEMPSSTMREFKLGEELLRLAKRVPGRNR